MSSKSNHFKIDIFSLNVNTDIHIPEPTTSCKFLKGPVSFGSASIYPLPTVCRLLSKNTGRCTSHCFCPQDNHLKGAISTYINDNFYQ